MPEQLLAGAARYGSAAAAPPARTLLSILDATVALHPQSPALDDGVRRLDYATLRAEVTELAERFARTGVRRGDRVGVRIPSGSADLYIAILAVLAAGAAYVPVDVDDPEERARLVFGEAAVRAVIGEGLSIELRGEAAVDVLSDVYLDVSSDVALDLALDVAPSAPATEPGDHEPAAEPNAAESTAAESNAAAPEPGDDAWIIFTSGSTGTPKGVAVTHRGAAAFVDAEARIFLRNAPLGLGDRVLAGLSVAFDASCEEMWLAWRHGACLVPAPRSLVRSGVDLGPWLVEHGITAVSTVPTLASLWPVEALDHVRLLIFGGEVCPPELAERLAVDGREVWNTYGPTEATVVATAAPLTGEGPVRIGLPLDGWELAVIDPQGRPVASGQSGELVIAGAGMARYLDPEKDAAKYAPLPSVGWDRAYRSGDLVRADPEGLVFLGRADEQIKLGGRRIELGEIDAALQALPGVAAAAAAVRGPAGGQVLIGYVVPSEPVPDSLDESADFGPIPFDAVEARSLLIAKLPAALVPRIAIVDALPTRTSGKVDRNALPWPLPDSGIEIEATEAVELTPRQEALAEQWAAVLGERPPSLAADFFDAGGGSLAAARFVSVLRAQHPTVTVRDVYDNPSFGGLSARLTELTPTKTATTAQPQNDVVVTPVPRWFQWAQVGAMIPLSIIGSMRWLTVLAALADILAPTWAPHVAWAWIAVGFVLFVTPPGRIAVTALGTRALLRDLQPGEYPRGGGVHLRLWAAEQLSLHTAVVSIASGPWIPLYARALGARIHKDAVLHSPPPVTGMLRLAEGAAIEPEVDLSGHWIDGGTVRVGEIRVDANASVGARSTLLPGARIGRHARVAPGSAVDGEVPGGQHWAGSPAKRVGKLSKSERGVVRAPYTRHWTVVYGLTASLLGLIPLAAAVPALAVLGSFTSGSGSAWAALGDAIPGVLPAVLVFFLVFGLLLLLGVRALSIGMRPGDYPLHSPAAWRVWTTTQLMGMARVWLYPLYASIATPTWLRLLGMKVGRDVELSTVLAVPAMTSVDNGAFLADDTMIAPYELSDGRLSVGTVRIGKRVFVGNSGMVGHGRKLPKGSLVGVLSAAPRKAKRGKSYLGMPPERLRRANQDTDSSLTYDPPRKLKAARAAVEVCRVIPAACTAALLLLAAAIEVELAANAGLVVATVLGGPVILGVGALAAALSSAAKWALVGRIKAEDQPLWSSFVWRNELADNFIELIAAPWFAESWLGTAPLNLWLRSLGSKIGRGVWCDTYWLPEADLIVLEDGATVNRGCVVQTHLFHDRVMSMDVVTLHAGATLGPQCVILPAASIGAAATVGPASLVMRGEGVPARTRWAGNPIAPWTEHAGDEEN
ncbi:Pls/PosA family non-ribosomal peptide synthetase [Actinospica sp.]|uniref:Pls/PosA family non-ribosomal peptide synthetase n=1 Tax=Actinospica sp. TaxID=1872142 RepID=UPI002B8CB42E|nr:Pls/PosA family non-ribosomal peptide synthetase [Actinospica sp.]HWG23387.1 Pls/PosA family non-ribosomal peptide synthetase [Actinospica sp.]